MASIESFEETARLDPAALRALLESARPEQRVWAIWALALRSQDVVGLAQRTPIEPDPGVRRTLAVILASHGETDLLVALARHDPAIVVRASAMQLVTRLAAGGAIDRVVVLDAARGEPAIQIAILGAIGAESPEFLVDLAGRLIGEADETVQLEAFEALVRAGTPASLERATDWLRVLGTQLVADGYHRSTREGYSETIARAVEPLSVIVRSIAMRALHRPSWQVVQQVAGSDASLRVEAASRPDVTAPLPALQQLLIECPGVGAVIAVQRQLARPGIPPYTAMLREMLAHCQVRNEALLAANERRDPATIGDDAMREEHLQLVALAEQLQRLVRRYR